MKKYIVTVNGISYDVEVEEVLSPASAPPAARPEPAKAKAEQDAFRPAPKSVSGTEGAIKITAPMPGSILKINAAIGTKVKRGDVLCLLEAMKMENEISAPQDGTVASVNISQGASVETGELIMTLS